MGHAAADISTVISWRSLFVKMKKELYCLLATLQSCRRFQGDEKANYEYSASRKPHMETQSSLHLQKKSTQRSSKRFPIKMKNQSQFLHAKKSNLVIYFQEHIFPLGIPISKSCSIIVLCLTFFTPKGLNLYKMYLLNIFCYYKCKALCRSL